MVDLNVINKNEQNKNVKMMMMYYLLLFSNDLFSRPFSK